MATVLASYKTDTNPGEALFAFGTPNHYNGAAQPFSHSQGATYRVSSIMIKTVKNGSPTETVKLGIAPDVAGQPGTIIGFASILAADYPTSASEYTVTVFNTPIDLATGTTYWLVWYCDNEGSDFTNYYQWRISNSSIVYSAEWYNLNNVFIIETGYNCYFEVQGNLAPTSLIKTFDAVAQASVKTFLGVTNATTKTFDGVANT